MDQIIALDQWLFYLINGIDIGFLDAIMPYYRHKLFWAPLYIFIIAAVMYNFPKHGYWIVLFSVMTVGFSDTVSSKWIKHSVKRLRPCNDPIIKVKTLSRVRCGGGYSFTSSHATNHGALAFFYFFLFQGFPKWWRWLGVAWAASIGVAQVFVGVHYPIDVLVGLTLGMIIGLFWAKLYLRFYKLV